MQKPIKSLLTDNLFIVAITITIIIAYLSLMRMPKTEVISFGNSDKVYHLIAYFSLSISWLFSFYKKKSIKLLIIISCVIYGIIIEVLQSILTEYRTGDYKDILANTLGIVLGLLIFNLIIKKIKLN
ncbi:VanZ family protein [Polaribacter sp. DS7-9]|nr:VanZ family protein [Polaribacter sp. DS7-9]